MSRTYKQAAIERGTCLMQLNELFENQPLYKDSGLWQVRSDDMEDVLFQQGVNESFPAFIDRVFKAQHPERLRMWEQSMSDT